MVPIVRSLVSKTIKSRTFHIYYDPRVHDNSPRLPKKTFFLNEQSCKMNIKQTERFRSYNRKNLRLFYVINYTDIAAI